jgi:hypothetical protein
MRMRKVVIYLKNKIKSGENRILTDNGLKLSLSIARALRLGKMERFAVEGLALAAAREDNHQIFEDALVALAKQRAPSFTLVHHYIMHNVRSGHASRIDEILDSNLTEGHRALIKAAALRADGRLDEALETLSVTAENFRTRLQIAREKRGLYHQMQDHEGLSQYVADFLDEERKAILIPLAISAAGSAETAHREDLFARSISRLISDLNKVEKSRSLFRLHWKDAFTAALTLYDPQRALQIAKRAKSRRLNGRKFINQAETLLKSLGPIMHLVDEGRQDMLERAEKRPRRARRADVVVVFPAAALRSNAIDYPGFRADIRRVYKGIIEALDREGVAYIVKSRIRTHGTVDFDIPFFSYHTISDSKLGLHIKETDRRSLFSFDNRGYAGWSAFSNLTERDLVHVDSAVANAFFDEDQRQAMEKRVSKYVQTDKEEQLPERFIFVGLQVIGDAVQSLAYRSPFEMIDEVLETARRQNLKVVVKRHPACKSAEVAKYIQAKQEAGEIQIATGNIHDIIPASSAVCVVNSGVGAEALLYEKPVYVFGRSDYMSACFVCKDQGDFSRQFVLGATRLSASDFRKFWYLYRNEYACDLTDHEKAKEWIAHRVRSHLAQAFASDFYRRQSVA